MRKLTIPRYKIYGDHVYRYILSRGMRILEIKNITNETN